jgi:hypothetical protein
MSVVDHCHHGDILIEVGFGIGLAILVGNFLNVFALVGQFFIR